MNRMRYVHTIIVFLIFFLPHSSPAESPKNRDFVFFLILTQQDMEMDWWYYIPSRFQPRVSPIDEVTRGEFFTVLPIFGGYGAKAKRDAHVTHDVEILKPDGTILYKDKSIMGFKGPSPGFPLRPSVEFLNFSFTAKDPYGEYTVNVSAYDHVKKRKINRSKKINLKEFNYREFEGSTHDWILKYPTEPKPALALSTLVSQPEHYLNDKGHPRWSYLWFYKYVYTKNDFLIPYTIEYYKTEATDRQRKGIILLFHLLNKADELPLEQELRKYLKDLGQINIPNPYGKIVTGEQLDMLWAEFFATSRIKPLRHILTAMNLSIYEGTFDKVKAGELEHSDEVERKVALEAVYQGAIWSIVSNCGQSPLSFAYFTYLYETGKISETEKGLLGAILKQVLEEKQKAIEQSGGKGADEAPRH